MDTAWTTLILLAIVAFAILERHALKNNKTTLSRYVVNASRRWPVLPFVVGVIVGGLAVHFWWPWCPYFNTADPIPAWAAGLAF